MLEILVSAESMPAAQPLFTIGYIFQLIISLGVVIGLIYFSAKYLFPKLQMPSQGRSIQVLDRVGIEPQVSAYIISAQDKAYFIIVSNKGVTLIDKLESGV
jgi:flagellar biogenesis protein FliO